MSDVPPAVLYESPTAATANDAIFWPLFRLAIVLWSAAVLCRHAIYWGIEILRLPHLGHLRSHPMRFQLVFAAAESLVLVFILLDASNLRRGNRRQHAILAILCGAFIVISLLGFITSESRTFNWAGPLVTTETWQVLWRFVTRLQTLIIPAMAILAFWRWKR